MGLAKSCSSQSSFCKESPRSSRQISPQGASQRGPLAEQLPFPVYISPLGSVEKPGSKTVRRVIVDSSFPKGRGLNSYIPKHFYRGKVVRVKLPNIDTIVQMVRNAKERYTDKKLQGFKVDLDAYYRYINTNPGESALSMHCLEK